MPDLGIRPSAIVWAGLMFFSAVLNIVLALAARTRRAGRRRSRSWAIGSKVALFLIQYAVMKSTGIRRARAAMAAAPDRRLRSAST